MLFKDNALFFSNQDQERVLRIQHEKDVAKKLEEKKKMQGALKSIFSAHNLIPTPGFSYKSAPNEQATPETES